MTGLWSALAVAAMVALITRMALTPTGREFGRWYMREWRQVWVLCRYMAAHPLGPIVTMTPAPLPMAQAAATTAAREAPAPPPPSGAGASPSRRGDWKETGSFQAWHPVPIVRPWLLFDGPITPARCAAWISERDYARQMGWTA